MNYVSNRNKQEVYRNRLTEEIITKKAGFSEELAHSMLTPLLKL